MIKRIRDRRALVTGLGAVIAAFTAGARPMRAQSVGRGFSPARHDTDRWMDQLPGKHRVFVDSASGTGGEDTLRFAGNLFTVNRTAYGVAPADLAIIVCYRHNSTRTGTTTPSGPSTERSCRSASAAQTLRRLTR